MTIAITTKTRTALVLTALMTASFATVAAPLTLDVYNPGEKSIFPVSSEIISGKNEVVLIDAQFQKDDALVLVDKIRATGKTLTTIYISHSDPDFYFGLDELKKAFPDAKIVATQQTVDLIKESKDGKLAYWGPVLKENAPQTVIVPETLKGNRILLEGESILIEGLDGPAPERSYVWVPSLSAVMGGVLVSENIHVWLADTQTPQSRQHWQQSLKEMQAKKTHTVVPGHYTGNSHFSPATIQFTADYLTRAEAALPGSKDSQALINTMKAAYPALADEPSLELSAKVLKGEMQWPQ